LSSFRAFLSAHSHGLHEMLRDLRPDCCGGLAIATELVVQWMGE